MSRRRIMLMNGQEDDEMKEEKIVDITLEEESKDLLTSLTQDMYEKIVNAKEIFCVATIEGSAEDQSKTGVIQVGIYSSGGYYSSSWVPINTFITPQNNTYKTGFNLLLFRGSKEEKSLFAIANGRKSQYGSVGLTYGGNIPSGLGRSDSIRLFSTIPMGVGTNLKVYIRR